MKRFGIEAEVVLDRFVEGLFRLMLDHHQSQIAQMGLTAVQAQALGLLRAAPLPTSKLASALGISAPAVTQLTDRLSRKELIERQTTKTDRRTVMVAVTLKGGRVMDDFRTRRGEVFADSLSRLSEEDRKEVIEALRKVTAVLQGHERSGIRGTGEAAQVPEYGSERRTPNEAANASNRVERAPVSLPKKRIRIEWD